MSTGAATYPCCAFCVRVGCMEGGHDYPCPGTGIECGPTTPAGGVEAN